MLSIASSFCSTCWLVRCQDLDDLLDLYFPHDSLNAELYSGEICKSSTQS